MTKEKKKTKADGEPGRNLVKTNRNQRMGADSKMTPERKKRLLDAIRTGAPLRAAAEYAEIG